MKYFHLLVTQVFGIVVTHQVQCFVMRRAVVQFPAHLIPFTKIPTLFMLCSMQDNNCHHRRAVNYSKRAHAYIHNIDILFNNLLFSSALCICSLPSSHPLHAQIRSCYIHHIRRHLLPIHHLLYHTHLDHKQIEVVTPTRKSPGYSPPFDILISPSKDEVLHSPN